MARVSCVFPCGSRPISTRWFDARRRGGNALDEIIAIDHDNGRIDRERRPMRLNAATNGALRILMVCRDDKPLTMPEMTRQLGLTEALVIKTCNELMQAGFLSGQRGRGGGYRLARPAQGINAMEIIDLFEAEENLFPVVSGWTGSAASSRCASCASPARRRMARFARRWSG